jgi:LytR cell envelope-related transcriptional attenuator
MNAARIRALVIVGLLFISAVVLAKITISGDKQSHTNYDTGSCPAAAVKVVTNPLPDYSQINLKIYNGSKIPGEAQNVADQFSHRGFKVAPVGKGDDKPTTTDVADISYGPKTLGAAWVVRAEFLLTDLAHTESMMHFDIKNTSNVVVVTVGTGFRQLGAKTEVNQAFAALGTPPAPAGTCAENP